MDNIPVDSAPQQLWNSSTFLHHMVTILTQATVSLSLLFCSPTVGGMSFPPLKVATWLALGNRRKQKCSSVSMPSLGLKKQLPLTPLCFHYHYEKDMPRLALCPRRTRHMEPRPM